MSQSNQVTFINGAGRVAEIKGQTAYKGMQVRMFNEVYTLQECRPKGIGFRAFAINAEGKTFEFKTKELTPVDATGNIINDEKGEAVIYSNQNDWAIAVDAAGLFRTGVNGEIHAINGTGITVGTSRNAKDGVPGYHFIFSGFLPKTELEKKGLLDDGAPAPKKAKKAKADKAPNFKPSVPAAAIARAAELTANADRPVTAEDAFVATANTDAAPMEALIADIAVAQAKGVEAIVDVVAPVFVRTVCNAKRAGLQDRGDPVSVFLRAAVDFDSLHALLTRVGFDGLEQFWAQYKASNLSFGTTKMNFGNRLRSQVKKGLKLD